MSAAFLPTQSMSLLELIFALHVNEFAVPDAAKLSEAVSRFNHCSQSVSQDASCASIMQEFIERKERLGGVYANFQ